VAALTLVQSGVSARFRSSVTGNFGISTGTLIGAFTNVTDSGAQCAGGDVSFVFCTGTGTLNGTTEVDLAFSTNEFSFLDTFTLTMKNTGTLPIIVAASGTDSTGGTSGMDVSIDGGSLVPISDFTSPQHLTGILKPGDSTTATLAFAGNGGPFAITLPLQLTALNDGLLSDNPPTLN
jgi:hypothetical protein